MTQQLRGPSPALHVLFDPGAATPATAAERMYGGLLRFPSRPSPYVVTNFVSTMDGVVSLGLHDGTDASTVGGHSQADRFVMAMLRAASDVVLIGAHTLADSAGHQWTPRALEPQWTEAMHEYRAALGHTSETAPLAVVTGSGQLPDHVALSHPATETVIVTTKDGAARIADTHRHVTPLVIEEPPPFRGAAILAALREQGWRLVLCEGGPSLMGAVLESGAATDLFMTIAPHVAGRDAQHARHAMVEGFVAPPGRLVECELLSARRAEAHLFLRYRRRR